MSCLTRLKVLIKDIEAARTAASQCGLVFLEGQTTFKKWSSSGKCEHAIGVPGKSDAYEIGLIRDEENDGWTPEFDSHMGGHGLMFKAGDGLRGFLKGYAVEASKNYAQAQGMTLSMETTNDDGSIELEFALAY